MAEQPTMIKAVARFAFNSGLNIALRSLTLASKFFLLIYLAKVLSPEQLGVYGLFTVTISYALYFLGLDFYTYAQREMLSLPHKARRSIIHNQFMLYAVVYLFVLPLLVLVFVTGLLPWQVAGWFYLILTLEHLSQELYRLLVVFGKVTLANITLFFRGGAWVFAVILLFWTTPEIDGLTAICSGWSVGVAISIAIAFFYAYKEVGSSSEKIITDWLWIRCGLKVATQFLLGTLALRGLFTFDRYFLDFYAGKSSVGIYSFYMGIANALLGFTDAGVISKLYPLIVATYRSGRYDEYIQNLKKLAIGIIFLFVAFACCLFVTINPVLHYIGREVYIEQINSLWILVGAMGVYCLGLVPHYALYAQSADRSVVIASLLSVIVFVVAALYLTPHGGASGMSLAILIGVGCLGILKAGFCIRNNNKIVN